LLALPRRPYNQKVHFHPKAEKVCVTNNFPIDLGRKYPHIYQFTFDTEPAIPQDSKEILYQCIRSVKKQLRDKIEVSTYSGNMIWGLK
jgi:hypothetical protein